MPLPKLIACLICSLGLQNAPCQILNFEKLRSQIDTSKSWNLSVDARFDLTKKIVSSTNFHTGINHYFLSKQHGYYVVGDLNFTRIDGQSIFNQGFAHGRTVLRRTKKISFEHFIQMQYDLGKGLKSRYLGGANIRLNLLEDSLKIFTLGTGLFYEDEKWVNELESSHPLANRNAKSNSYLSALCQINAWSQVVLTGYYQATFERFLSGRLIIESNINMKFTDRFRYNIDFSLSADPNPVVETGRLVYRLSTGFRYVIH